jgi:type IV pilus assembly protein PilA
MFSSAIARPNDRRDAAGDIGEDAGFTLIELMVVLLILAILLAIAIPTFLGVTKSANDRAAQSNLNTALLNAKAQYQQNSQAYPATGALVTALQSAEPSVTFTAGNSTDQNHVSVFVTGDSAALVMAVYSVQTKNCWIVVDTPTATTAVASSPFVATSQTPVVAVDTTLVVGATGPVTFATNQLGPTYAEMKTTATGTVTAAACQAGTATSAPSAIINTNYRYSFTAFPSI